MSSDYSRTARSAIDQRGHWAHIGERGAAWGPALMAFVYRTFGRRLCLLVMAPVIVYFFATGRTQRLASIDYLRRIWRVNGLPGRPGYWQSLRHFFAFGSGLVDKFASWIGDLQRGDIAEIDGGTFDVMRDDPRGALLISAHVGNSDIVRAIASRDQKRRVNVIIHTAQAQNFNRLIERFAPHSTVRLIPAAQVDVGVAVMLSAAVERGEWVVIMGDRSPVRLRGRTITAQFLGEPAELPLGPFSLAGALKCSCYFLACYRTKGRYRVRFVRLSEADAPQPRGRTAALILVEKYLALLEEILRDAPYQWFNFYDFWARPAPEVLGGRGQDSNKTNRPGEITTSD